MFLNHVPDKNQSYKSCQTDNCHSYCCYCINSNWSYICCAIVVSYVCHFSSPPQIFLLNQPYNKARPISVARLASVAPIVAIPSMLIALTSALVYVALYAIKYHLQWLLKIIYGLFLFKYSLSVYE